MIAGKKRSNVYTQLRHHHLHSPWDSCRVYKNLFIGFFVAFFPLTAAPGVLSLYTVALMWTSQPSTEVAESICSFNKVSRVQPVICLFIYFYCCFHQLSERCRVLQLWPGFMDATQPPKVEELGQIESTAKRWQHACDKCPSTASLKEPYQSCKTKITAWRWHSSFHAVASVRLPEVAVQCLSESGRNMFLAYLVLVFRFL